MKLKKQLLQFEVLAGIIMYWLASFVLGVVAQYKVCLQVYAARGHFAIGSEWVLPLISLLTIWAFYGFIFEPLITLRATKFELAEREYRNGNHYRLVVNGIYKPQGVLFRNKKGEICFISEHDRKKLMAKRKAH